LLIALCLCLTELQQSGQVRGTVRDARTGETLAITAVQLVETQAKTLTGASGQFDLGAIAPGEYTLKVSTVGYRLSQTRFEVKDNESVELDIVLSPDSFQRTERIEVRADPFDISRQAAGSDFAIDGSETKNLASVLADDPLRAAQMLPGVSSNDDFDSRFSLRGAPYDQIGLYLDDILLHTPFHTVQGEGPSGSLTVFNGDVVDSMTLRSGAYPSRYEDRTAGVLDVQTRDGSRSQTTFRFTAGAPDAGAMAEGPIGRDHKGSWLASFRKSYLQYLLKQSADQTAMAFGFMDSQVQAAYDVTRGNTVKLRLIDGTSDLDRGGQQNQLALNSSLQARYHFTLANAEWQYTPNQSFQVRSHMAFMRERYDDVNRNSQTLGQGYYGEWVGKTSATWVQSGSSQLEIGASVRWIRGDGFADYYFDASAHTRVENHRGNETLTGGYAQESWNGLRKRVYLSGGVRWDSLDVGGRTVASPQASAAFLPTQSTRLQVAWGQYAQFPDVQYLFATYGNRNLLPSRATHISATLEQRLGNLSRLRIEVYQRNDRDHLFRPYLEARLEANQIVGDNFSAPLTNSLRGNTRGMEFFLQRRTANRLNGWISYALNYSRMQDSITDIRFPSDQDQRHTVNVYLGYRIRPSVNLSTKWTYGSGFPVPGFFQKSGDTYVLSASRNEARLDPYQRTDVRINKSRSFDRWKMTIYAEVVNIFNRPNYRFDSYNGFDSGSRQAYLSFSKMFPVLPAAGMMVEF
jgi:hypothetical protein